jgi:hypothetical protein
MRVDLTERELQLVRSAVRAFFQDFGHDQPDLHREIRAIQAKLDAAAVAAEPGGPASVTGTDAGPARRD